jgi:homocysteine S-methyltransferase
MPLVSYKNAMFMKNEMPGIDVPDEVVNRYRMNMSREEAEAPAVSVCVDIGKQVRDFADGYYIMTPFNRVAMVNRIINELREQEQILS